MMKTSLKALLILVLSMSLVSTAQAQAVQTGHLQGKVVDEEGVPLPGVSITASSPILMGIRN